MGCWVNAAKSITPILQQSNSPMEIGLILYALLYALCFPAAAQQPAKRIPRVGFLSLNRATVQKDRVEAFRERYESWDTSTDKTSLSITASRTTTPNEWPGLLPSWSISMSM